MSNRYDRGRFELKYLLPSARRTEVLSLVSDHMRPDPHATTLSKGRRGYAVHSLYLDTADLADYFDRLDEKKVRTRTRVRTYGLPHQPQRVFLEVKRKSGPWVVKHRVSIGDSGEWRRCCAARPWTALAADVQGRGRYAAMAFLQLADRARRVPATVVHYEREVFVPSDEDSRRIRLTLDYGIGARRVSSGQELFAPSEVDLIPPDWMILELKFERFAPSWMTSLRRELGITAIPFSKFGLSVARAIRAAHPHELRALLPPSILQRRIAA